MTDGQDAEHLELRIPWCEVVALVAERGWASVAGAIGPALIDELSTDERREWRVHGDEGVAHQLLYGAYLPLLEARPPVRQLAQGLMTGLSEAASRRGLPPVPAFNEVSWGRYPPGIGQITAHRDPSAYGGVIAIFTLRGAADFRVFEDDGTVTEWEVSPGHLVILRGVEWPHAKVRRPVHEVGTPTGEERSIITLRANRRGSRARSVA